MSAAWGIHLKNAFTHTFFVYIHMCVCASHTDTIRYTCVIISLSVDEITLKILAFGVRWFLESEL